MNEKLRRNTIDFAIDLGTSDSVVACFNGQEPRIIKNHFTGENHTPSAVYMDDLGEIHIGKVAKDAVIKNPENAVSEFKLDMGFPIPFYFKDADKKMFPEQLSSEILKDLKKSIYYETGQNIEEIVITVPANSNPLKTRATKDAAELAGFKSVYLVLEPVAAAIAYGLRANKEASGIWMIYDLGGGTFDVSLVKANGEEIEKLATSGEDNLGGKLFDWKIVDDYFTPKIIEDLKLNDFRRDNPEYLKVFALLKNEAEKAKIALSTSNDDISDYRVSIENLFRIDDTSYDFSYILTKEDLKSVMKPFLKTTFNHCHEILEENAISIEEVEKIILVGGSTLSPIIRENIESEFNRPLEYGINPLTVVAEGASVYAGLDLEVNEDYNEFFINIFDENNNLVDIDEKSANSINYKHALNPSYPILTSSIALYLDEDSSLILNDGFNDLIDFNSEIDYVKEYSRKFNSSHIVASKGDKLPISKKEILHTEKSIEKGDRESFIKLLFYSGELILADYNTFLGEIIIDGNDLIDDLPKESEIELNIKIDESNLISFEVFIPYLRQTFNNSFIFNNYMNYNSFFENYENLKSKYDEIIEKYDILKDFALDDGNKNLFEENGFLDRVFENIEEIEKKEITNYLKILIDMAKYDKIAIYPSLEYLNYLDDVLDECKLFLNISNIDIGI